MCSYPTALFDSCLLLHEADKPALSNAIWKITESSVPKYISDDGIQYVLDEGTLYNESHGLVALHMEKSATSIPNTLQESTRMP